MGSIYFDFDRTLIDTDALKIEQNLRIANITGLTPEEVQQGMVSFIASIDNHLNFDAEKYAFFLEEMYGVNPSDVIKIYLTNSQYIEAFLYPEVKGILKSLKEQGWELGIFSGAIPGHQIIKIQRTGVLDFIPRKNVIIEPQKTEMKALAQLPKGVYIVDDDQSVITELLEKASHSHPIWCNRKSSEKMKGVPTIHELSELLTIL